MTEQPGTEVSAFASRIAPLLAASVSVAPGEERTITEVDAVRALTAVVDPRHGADAAPRLAAEWLHDVLRGGRAVLIDQDRPALIALATLLRVPLSYFLDSTTAESVASHMSVAAAARRQGVCIIGPCRCGSLDDEAAFVIYDHVVESLNRHASPAGA